MNNSTTYLEYRNRAVQFLNEGNEAMAQFYQKRANEEQARLSKMLTAEMVESEEIN